MFSRCVTDESFHGLGCGGVHMALARRHFHNLFPSLGVTRQFRQIVPIVDREGSNESC